MNKETKRFKRVKHEVNTLMSCSTCVSVVSLCQKGINKSLYSSSISLFYVEIDPNFQNQTFSGAQRH